MSFTYRVPNLLFLLLFVLQYDTLQQNYIQLHALKTCSNSTKSHDASQLSPWWRGMLHLCQSNREAATGAWRVHLANSDQRIDLIRAVMPSSKPLAQTAAEAWPQNAQALFWHGDVLADEGALEQALAFYVSGLALEDNPLSWVKIGRIYEQQNDPDNAINAFDRACVLGDRGHNGCTNAGRLYLARQAYLEAIDRYSTSIQRIPSFYPPAHQALVTAYLEIGRTDAAIHHLQQLANHGDSAAQTQLSNLQHE